MVDYNSHVEMFMINVYWCEAYIPTYKLPTSPYGPKYPFLPISFLFCSYLEGFFVLLYPPSKPLV